LPSFYYKGSIPLTASIQDYDLKQWALEQGIAGGIEIKRVFYEAPPAVVRYFDPYAGTGYGYQALFDSFGFGSFSPAINFLMMPLNYDLQTLQAIELNDMVRRSNYSFELKNNVLSVFPIPMKEYQVKLMKEVELITYLICLILIPHMFKSIV